jgi:hypothetical protein
VYGNEEDRKEGSAKFDQTCHRIIADALTLVSHRIHRQDP